MNFLNTRFTTHQHPCGQGLLEMIIALAIITSGILAMMTLTLSNQTASEASENRLIAANLAREGIEAARNIRDSNWLACTSDALGVVSCAGWDDSLYASGDETAALFFDSATNAWTVDFANVNAIADNAARVWRSTTGSAFGTYFQTSEANPENAVVSPFRRMLTINPICLTGAGLKVVRAGDSESCEVGEEKIGIRAQSQVQWSEKGNTATLSMEERLFNWR